MLTYLAKQFAFAPRPARAYASAIADAPVLTAAEIQRRYLPAVYGYVSARLANSAEAGDTTADVFAAAFAGLHRAPKPAAPDAESDPVRAWLFGIARRKVADALRGRSRRPQEPLGEREAEMLAAPPGDSPEAKALTREAAHTLRGILETLPEIQREALCLRYAEELSADEIGAVMRKSANAVRQILHRARETVRTRGAFYFAPDSDAGEIETTKHTKETKRCP